METARILKFIHPKNPTGVILVEVLCPYCQKKHTHGCGTKDNYIKPTTKISHCLKIESRTYEVK